ncbi:phage tail protein [Plesiomonas shigelloides]|uniref:phage tail protein n=1 Tax=Plesiomonas shigelloides TaxID=703 RepID=UPI00068C1BF5|nr:phage tail protein [Plesiomonas shigelloides]
MAKYFAILTNLGAGKLANAAALGTKLEMTHIAVGDGGGVSAPEPTPDPAMTDLLGEKRRAAINSLSIDPLNPNQIIVEQVIPETDGGFWIREIGLFDKAGTLIAYSNCAGSYKPQLQEGSGRALVIRMILIVSSTEAVSLKIDPSVVLATRKYVDDSIIEVRTYADNLMGGHLSAEHPHKQYAKNTAVLAKDKNGEDIQDKAQFRQHLGIKSAALRDVGTGINQIPDMSAWQYGGDFINGWKRAPDGTIEQWGMSAGVTTDDAQIRFHIPFTTGIYELNEHDSGQGSSQITTLWTFIDVTLTGAIARNIGSFTRGVPTLNAPSLSQCRWHAKGK